MTKRERILSVLNRQKPDKIPWAGDLAYWVFAEVYDGRLSKDCYFGKELLKVYEELGVGYYLQGFHPFTTHYEGVDIKIEEAGNTTTTKYITPKGTLTEVWQFSPSTYSNAPKEFMVKSADDFAALQYLYEHTYYEPDNSRLEILQNCIDDQGIILCYTPRSPLMELIVQKAGVENTIYALDEDEDGFLELFTSMMRKTVEASEITIASACDCVMVGENLSSEVVGKHYYQEYVEDFHRFITKQIHDAGKYSFIHMDGTLKGLLGEVCRTGFDVIEALTPAPVGDVTVEEIVDLMPEDVIFWGGIPGGFFTDIISDAQFDDFVKEVLEVLCTRPNSVLGVADQVIPGSLPKRIRRVAELVEAYGDIRY